MLFDGVSIWPTWSTLTVQIWPEFLRTGLNFYASLDFPRNGRQTRTSNCGAFKRLGTNATQMAVAWGSIVKKLGVIKQVGASQVSGFVNTLSETLLFQRAEE